MNRKPTMRVLAGTAAVAVVFAASPGLAAAADDATDVAPDRTRIDRPLGDRSVDDVRARILEAIDERLGALDRMSETVAGNQHVEANHAAHLQNDYREATRILENAAEDVAEAETIPELRQAIEGVFAETLVFALLAPKTHLVVASDASGAIAGRMIGFAEMLSTVIERLEANGHDLSDAKAAIAAAGSLIEDAVTLAGPVADAVIDLDPEDWPDPAQGQLEAGRNAVMDARELFRQARDRLHTAIEEIRAALGSDS